MTEHHRLSDLTEVYSSVLEAETSRTKVQGACGFRAQIPDVRVAAFSLCPHMGSSLFREREQVSGVFSFSCKDINPFRLGPHPCDLI